LEREGIPTEGLSSKSWDSLSETPDAVFEQAYRILRTRIEALLASPLDNLRKDPAALKVELERIGIADALRGEACEAISES
jgi:arsenate reductase